MTEIIWDQQNINPFLKGSKDRTMAKKNVLYCFYDHFVILDLLQAFHGM